MIMKKTNLNILLIEDFAPIARAFEALLLEAGHKVSWFVGAKSLQPLVLVAEDRSEQLIDASQFDFAFCDGQLVGPIEGAAIVKVLCEAKVVCAGISSMKPMNDAMVANGANVGFNKAVGLFGLLSKRICPLTIIDSTPNSLNDLPAEIEATFRSDKVNYDACDALLNRFLVAAKL